MSTRRKYDNNPSTSAFIPPSYLPEEIIISILKLLPVKSILRFKRVSKHWHSILSTPSFISIHLEESLKTPLNDAFIIRFSQTYLLSVERAPVSLDKLFTDNLWRLDLVGSINGLLCLGIRWLGHTVTLWNPALNLHKAIRLPITDEAIQTSSLGFAYDAANDDYKIFRIDCLKNSSPADFYRSRAEVYSASLDTWERVEIGFHFVTPVSIHSEMVKGIPYWVGVIYEPNNEFPVTKILMYYDMRNGSFKHVSLPQQELNDAELFRKQHVEWKGNLGRIVSRGDFVDILVYDEMRMCWNKIESHGPIGLKIKKPVQCSKDGVILADTEEGKLMLYDSVTNRIKTFGIKEFCTPGTLGLLHETFTYTESLVTIKGMEKFKEQDRDKS